MNNSLPFLWLIAFLIFSLLVNMLIKEFKQESFRQRGGIRECLRSDPGA